jgi:hypothetical protein
MLLMGAASNAAAQDTTTPSASPLVLESLESTFVFAPEVKVTNFAGDVGVLGGGYAGWIEDAHLLVGGGVYSLASDRDVRGLTYGGLILGWLFDPVRPVRVTARTLVGFGRASEVRMQDPDGIPYCALPEWWLCSGPRRFGPRPGRLAGYRENFLVAEPEVGVAAQISRHLRLTGGVGYRLTTRDRTLAPNPRGVTGTVAAQFTF